MKKHTQNPIPNNHSLGHFARSLLLCGALLGGSAATAQTVGYFASSSTPAGSAANNAGLNIGQTFTVAHTNIQITSLGVFDYGGDGLKAPHTVTLFSNQTALVSITVPAGTAAVSLNNFCFATLPTPVTLVPGTYSVVAYQMNGTANNSDGYGDVGSPARNGFNGSFNVQHVQTIFEFTSNQSAYPGTGGSSLGTASANLASASFQYTEPSSTTTIGYTADPSGAQYGQAADNSPGLNIGHTFIVSGTGIDIDQLGVFDWHSDGLKAAHTVTLFSYNGSTYTPVAGGSVTVPAGTATPLGNGFRFAPLAAPVSLSAGSYAIIVYQLNGNTANNDPYGEANVSGFNASGNVMDAGYSPYLFTSSGSPAFPTGGASVNFAVCSFTYSNHAATAGPTVAYTASTSGPAGVNGSNAGLNIGHTFTVANTNLQISSLGVYDYSGDGLQSAHDVTLFARVAGTYVAIPGGTVTVPAGTSATLTDGYRFQPLASPISLPPGTYAVVAYQMNGGTSSDPYSDASGANNNFFGGLYVNNGVSVYEFTTNPSPAFPGTGGGDSGTPTENFGCASFIYTLAAVASMPVSAPVAAPALTYASRGQNVTLTAGAFGTAPITYQWYYGSTPTLIAGATNATLTLTNVQPIHGPGNEGIYTASAANDFGGPTLGSSAEVRVVPPSAALKIMPLGDSITYGQGADGGYRAPLYQMLTAAQFNVNFLGSQNNNSTTWLPQINHEGHSGYRIDQISSGFLSWVNSVASPDIILLLIGTNDYGQQYDTAHATNRLDLLIGLIATNQPQARLIVANLTLRTENATYENQIEATFNPLVPSIVAQHAALGQRVSFVDLHTALGASDLIDGLHPNQSGYNKMAAAWFKAITGLVPAPGSTNAVLNVDGTHATINYGSVPYYQYVAERSTNISSGVWQPVSTNTVSPGGLFQMQDYFNDLNGVPASAFYRLRRL